MKPLIAPFVMAATAGLLLAGCKPAAESAPTGPTVTGPATTAPAAPPATPVADATKPPSPPEMVPKLAANPASQQAAVPATDLARQLQSLAGNQSDAVLASVTKDLSGTFKSLSDSLAGTPAVKSQLSSLTAALAGGKDVEALGASSLLAAAQLTPEQKKLAGDARNLLGAYITQKNFATLPGAQNEVAAIVDSLRKGDLMAAAAPLQKVAANASLTPAQKDVVSSLVKSYAPGVKDATDKLGGALKNLVPK